jgi:hypothetical protein
MRSTDPNGARRAAFMISKRPMSSGRVRTFACSTLGEPLTHSCFCPTAEICQEEVKDWDFVEENFRPIFKAYDSQFKLMRYHHAHLLARPWRMD